MFGRKVFYSLVILVITAAAVTVMVRFERVNDNTGLSYISPYYAYDNEDDSRYMGYIFDDYNKEVNLTYKDKSSAEPVDDGAISISSKSVLENQDTIDSARMLRSENVVEERAQMEGK